MNRNLTTLIRTTTILFAGAIMGIWFNNQNLLTRSFIFSPEDKVSKVLKLIKNNYVDTLNSDSLEAETINHLLQSLDPHSLHLGPQKASYLHDKLSGGFEGLGIEYRLLNDTLYVTRVYPNAPADKAGIQPGDRIVTLNGRPFAGTHLNADKVHGAFTRADQRVLKLGTLSYRFAGIKTLAVKRGPVVLSSIDVAYMLNQQTGYIKISKFAATTDSDFRVAVHKLMAQGLKKLVIDLRDNGGGYLNAATALADEFLPAGKLIMFTKGAHEPRTEYRSTGAGIFEKGKLAVLINEHSASASEIFAGAMQDLDRAVIIGRRSFGKGLVQQQYAFGDGSAINLTVARYYTPSGRSIQKSYSAGLESYNNELYQRKQKGELFSAQSNFEDSTFLKQAAYHTSRGRKVFAGGGIMPDVFVAADTLTNTRLLDELQSEQLFTAYALQSMQPALANYKSFSAFNQSFRVDDDKFTGFIVYASRSIKEMDSGEIKRSGERIRLMLKATLAGVKWGNEACFRIMNPTDNDVKRCLEVF